MKTAILILVAMFAGCANDSPAESIDEQETLAANCACDYTGGHLYTCCHYWDPVIREYRRVCAEIGGDCATPGPDNQSHPIEVYPTEPISDDNAAVLVYEALGSVGGNPELTTCYAGVGGGYACADDVLVCQWHTGDRAIVCGPGYVSQ